MVRARDDIDPYGRDYHAPYMDEEPDTSTQACESCTYCYRLVKGGEKQGLACAYELMWDEVGARVYEVSSDEWCENYEEE